MSAYDLLQYYSRYYGGSAGGFLGLKRPLGYTDYSDSLSSKRV